MDLTIFIFLQQPIEDRDDNIWYDALLDNLNCFGSTELDEIIKIVEVVRDIDLIVSQLLRVQFRLPDIIVIISDELVDLACKVYYIWGKWKPAEILFRFLLLNFISIVLLFMSYKTIFMTLVRTIKSEWLKYFMAAIANGKLQFFYRNMIHLLYCRTKQSDLNWFWSTNSSGRTQNIRYILSLWSRTSTWSLPSGRAGIRYS